ncbi:MAG: helix-turn-helix transcriptional regulator [Candidatus Dojkabacteria bacterium]|nr:helix-turn-helix transcriptional regulator [Candidatus Dojkabacteria bacterium]MDQ7021877.1 helix-turn-helix transcriptional regulator [Candidatus Dojkabacteria bacterium]
MSKESIANNIKTLRAEAGLTQEDLAKLVEVTRQTIIAIEKCNYSPSLELAFKISKVFNKDISKVFEYK